MPDGSLIGEINGVQTNRKLTEYDELYNFQILNAQGELLASVIEKGYPHQRTGFLKGAAWNFDFSWYVEGPSGEDLARLKRQRGMQDPSMPITSLETPSGTVIAQFERKALSIHNKCTVHIVNPVMDAYLVLASLFAHQPVHRVQPAVGKGRSREIDDYVL